MKTPYKKQQSKLDYIKRKYFFKNLKNLAVPLKTFWVGPFKIKVLQKKYNFKLRFGNVIVITPSRIVKKSTKRNKLKRIIKRMFSNLPSYLVVIAYLKPKQSKT